MCLQHATGVLKTALKKKFKIHFETTVDLIGNNVANNLNSEDVSFLLALQNQTFYI